MTHVRGPRRLALIALAGAVGVNAAGAAQMRGPAARFAATITTTEYAVPRTPWGDPDLQGTWTTDDFIGVPVQRPRDLGTTRYLTEEEFAERARRQAAAREAARANAAPGAAGVGPPDPDPRYVKWINPRIRRGEQRDVSVMVGEGGGLFVNDRATGEFLWATPFPRDTPDFLIGNIEGNGRVHLNTNVMFKGPAERHVICFWNTRSYWPTAYHPRLNSLYVPYVENCLDMTSEGPGGTPPERRRGIPRDGVDMEKWAGLAKVNLSTGEIQYLLQQRAPTQGAVLATAGDVIFWGDLNQKFRAFDAETGQVLWEQTLGGTIQNSTIT